MQNIPITKIKVSQTASQAARRGALDKGALEELTKSIVSHGVLQPIIVRKRGAHYELVAGERRVLSSKAAKLKTIPAVVRELSDEQVIEIQLIENLQREDLHAMQEAEGYGELVNKHGHAVDDLHVKVGKSRSYVYGRLKLLALCAAGRKAFYADEISPSVALLIARIPGDALQRKALKRITNSWQPLSFRRIKEVLTQEFMLRLYRAPFPTKDPNLVPKAGACQACPKRTGSQPEIYADIKSADVCTDRVCFASKVRAYGKIAAEAAINAGREVITGKKAKDIARWGVDRSYLCNNYVRADAKLWQGSKQKTVKAIVAGKAEPSLLQDPESGQLVEIFSEATVKRLQSKARKRDASSTPDPAAARRKKAKTEKAFRRALFERLRPKVQKPTMKTIAKQLVADLSIDDAIELCRVRGVPVEKGTMYESARKLEKLAASMSPRAAAQLVNDCLFVRELQVSTWSNSKPERLLAEAKRQRVNTAALRRSVAPKKKARKKAKAK